MANDVKRYSVFIGFEHGEQQMVLAADHDRIVTELQARVDRLSEDSIKDNANFGRAFKGLEAERDELVVRCREIEAQVDLLQKELIGAEICRKGNYEAAYLLREERDTQRAEVERLTGCLQKANEQAEHFEREWYLRGDEVERLKEHEPRLEDVERLVKTLSFLGVSTPESMETACIRWLSLVRTLIRTAEDSKMLRQDSERMAEAKRIRSLLIEAVVELKELKESVGYRAHTIGVIQRIDAALEASR